MPRTRARTTSSATSSAGARTATTSARPREDFPRLLGLYRAGRLKIDELITHRYRVDEAPQAFADLEAGKNARGVIVF